MLNLSISIIQSELFWEEPEMNCSMFEQKIHQIKGEMDVIVLPEMFSTGFTMNAKIVAEEPEGPSTQWMRKMARETQALVLGSLVIKEDENYFNRLLWVQPDGFIRSYDKRHLFRMANEHQIYTPGNSRLIEEWKGWKICPLVCYDLRFPVWSRNNVLDYDVLIYVANWPAARVNAWDTLLKARAIENLCYTIGVNRVGKDGNDIPYVGHSAIIDFKGDCLFQAGESSAVHSMELDYESLQAFRKKFPAHEDADMFTIDPDF
ncbi:MAG: amidohydrolase [Flammeovirgaceae bacterium]|nr:amidohydrolase [Flammeovirgaceae bacterium]